MVAAMRSNGLQLIIAGAPASGKGTQCELLRETYGVVHLSTGDMLREAAKDPDSEVGKTAKVFMEAGQLVPDDVIIGVVVERLAKQDCVDKGWLLDGFPRTRAQADALSAAGYHPDQFIFLDVPDKILVTRVVGRRTDPETGKIYHMTFSPPENEEIAARLQQRSDDTEAKVQVRLKAFHENLAPILAVYKQQLLRVNGDADKVDIFNRTKERLDRIRRYSVVFVLGGPGSGKGTQCANIVREFGYTHLSAGDLLREEQNCGSDVGEMIKTFIKEGKIVPVEVTIRLLKTAMERSGARDFLIDGFPRSFENMEGWFKEMGDVAEVAFVLFFDCPEEVMAERLLKRGATSGRADDNEASIRKRFVTFRDTSMPVVEALARLGKVRIVSAAPPPEVVFARVSRFFKGLAMIPPTERTLAIIKPDAMAAGSEPAMIQRLEQEGFVIVEKKTETLTSEKVDGFYQEHIGKPFFEGLKKFMTSGPCTALSLERVDAIRAWRNLLGPTNTEKARAEKPDSLRALYGTDGQRNAAHGSDSTASAIRELAFWFPEATPATRTLAMIKPGAAETVREEIMCCIAARGFEVVKTASQVLPRGMAAEFYAEHTGKPFFEGLLNFMTSGEVVALMLKREAAVPAWRALMGPTNSNAARKTSPDSLRALFGVDGQRNATHGSDGAASAARECMFWFPDRWAAAAEATGESAAAEARVGSGGGGDRRVRSAEAKVAAFMRDSVDPVLAPLLQRLVIAQPPDVVDFCVKELQALKRQAHS